MTGATGKLKPGFGEFFIGSLEAKAGTEETPSQSSEAALHQEDASRRAPLPESSEYNASLPPALEKSLPRALTAKLFQLQPEAPLGELSRISTPEEMGVWQLQFDEETNPVATKFFHAFVAKGIGPEEILGQRAQAGEGETTASTVITASDVLNYLDRNFSRPKVQRALRSPEIGYRRPFWRNKKGKLLPAFASKEFRSLSFSRKMAHFRAHKAEQAVGENKEFLYKKSLWFDPSNPERHRALGKAAIENGNYLLAQLSFYNAAQLDPNGPSAEAALHEALLNHTRNQFAATTDPLQKLYFQIRLSLLSENFPQAKLQMAAFKEQTADTSDESRLAQREEIRPMLRVLTQKDIAKLAEANEVLKLQRLSNFELNYYDERTAEQNAALLSVCTGYLQEGKADTLEECLALLQTEHEKMQREFWANPVIKKDWSVNLPSRKHRHGSDEAKAERKAAAELIRDLKANPGDPKFLEKGAYPSVPYVRIEGGQLRIPSDQAPAVRVIIGKAGGFIRMGEFTYSFKPAEAERVVILTPNFLLAPQLKRHVDYREDPHFGAPKEAAQMTTTDFKGGHPESLSSLLDHVKNLKLRDSDFQTLLDRETRAGWEKAATPEGKRAIDLQTAEELRHRNGSYMLTAELLEGIFAKEFENALSEISPEQIKELRKAVEGDHAHVSLETAKKIQTFKEDQPELYLQRFPKGKGPDTEFTALVDQAVEAKVAIQVRKLVFAKLAERHRDGKISDPLAARAWEIYEDLKDPLEHNWNLADESWDRIVDEVVLTAVTLPVTMGVGTLVRSGLSATTLALRWSAAGGLRAFGARGAIFATGAVTEGFVQEGLGSTLMGREFQLESAGLNVLMCGAFHGGGKAWNGIAGRLGVDEVAILAAKNRGGNVLLKSAANVTGSLSTQTAVATGMTYIEDLFHEAPPRTFIERLGGSAIRMVSYNLATKGLNLATGNAALRAEKLGQARLKHAEKRAAELRKNGVDQKIAAEQAVAEAKSLAWDANQENIIFPGGKTLKEKPVFASFFEEHAQHEAMKKATGVGALRRWAFDLAELSGLTSLQDKGAILEWALNNSMTPKKLQGTRKLILEGKIIFAIEKGQALIKLIPEAQSVAPKKLGVADFVPLSKVVDKAGRIAKAQPNAERIARYVKHLMKHEGLSQEAAEAKAQTWATQVILDARAHQAGRLHIYDTSLPLTPETAHLDAATIDHHLPRFKNEKNATEQWLQKMEAILSEVKGDKKARNEAAKDFEAMQAAGGDVLIAAALRKLNIREATTDNLADGSWSVWIAINQAKVLRNPGLRELITAATHFEDFTAFGTAFDRKAPGIRLQAAIFQEYGEIAKKHGMIGSDRFPPEKAQQVMGEAIEAIDRMLSNPFLREKAAEAFFTRVEEGSKVAAEQAVMGEVSVHDGSTNLTFFDLTKMGNFTLFQQWVSLPKANPVDTIQVSVIPAKPAELKMPDGSTEKIGRTLQIVAIPNARNLPSEKNLLVILDTFNAAEKAKAEKLGVKPNNWFGKENVILANPNEGGTLLTPAEVGAILRDPAVGLFERPKVTALELAKSGDQEDTTPGRALAAHLGEKIPLAPVKEIQGGGLLKSKDIPSSSAVGLELPGGKKISGSFDKGNTLYLGVGKSGIEVTSEASGKGIKAEITPISNVQGKTVLRIRPTGNDAVLIFDPKNEKELQRVSGNGETLRTGQILLVGGQAVLWNPGGRLSAAQVKATFSAYFTQLVLPRKLKAGQDAIPLIRDQVELLNATDRIVGKGKILSIAPGEYPTPEYNPVYTWWNHAKEGALFQDFLAAGNLRDVPGSEYSIILKGKQRFADTLARLKAQLGDGLTVLNKQDGEVRLLLRGRKGEALVEIHVKAEDLPIQNIKSVVAALNKIDIAELSQWAKEYSPRGEYAHRLLSLIGGKKDAEGRISYGNRLTGLLKQYSQAKNQKDKARAGEELATNLAYILDYPMLREEILLLQRSDAINKETLAYRAIEWMKSTGHPEAALAQQYHDRLSELSTDIRNNGPLFRSQVPFEMRVAGKTLFDAYQRAIGELQESVQYLEPINADYQKSPEFARLKAKQAKPAAEPQAKIPVAEEWIQVSDEIISPIDGDLTNPGRPSALVSAKKNPFGGPAALGLGLFTLLNAEVARAGEPGGPVATADSPSSLLIGLGIGAVVLLTTGLGAYFVAKKRSATKIEAKVEPKVETKKPEPEKAPQVLEAPKTELENKSFNRLAKTEIITLKPVVMEPFKPGPVEFSALQPNQDGKPRRANFTKEASEEYGPCAACTHEGVGYGQKNEDGFVQGSNWSLVLDGMGGEASGDKASAVGGRAFAEYMSRANSDGDLVQAMLFASQAINDNPSCKGKSKKGEESIGGAVAVSHRILKKSDGSEVAQFVHVGDAGALLLRPNENGDYEVVFRTDEQSKVNEERKLGKYKNTLIMRAAPGANQVTDGLGLGGTVKPVLAEVAIQKGDVILMYSDGIGDNFSKEELSALIRGRETPEAARDPILEQALAKMSLRVLAKQILSGHETEGGQIITIRGPEGYPKNVVELDALPGYGLDGRGDLFEIKSGQLVDHYKSDNVTLHVYFHQPEGPGAKTKIINISEMSNSGLPTQIIALPKFAKLVEKTPTGQFRISMTGDQGGVVIGREVEAFQGVPVGKNEISRRHAEITLNQGEYFLNDLSSKYGTWLNGEEIKPGEGVKMSPGDLIVLAENPGTYSGEAFQFDILPGGEIQLTPVLRLPKWENKLEIGGVTLARGEKGGFFIQNAEGPGHVDGDRGEVPYHTENFYAVKDKETLRIGEQTFVFRGE